MRRRPTKTSFNKHKERALSEYLIKRPLYQQFCLILQNILQESINRNGINVHSVQARAKEPESFGKKASEPSETDSEKPRYSSPLTDITDLAGVRIIAFFPSALNQIDEVIAKQFDVIERSDKGALLLAEEKFGYNSVHYLVKLSQSRLSLPEYEPFANLVAEVQVRTVLQHAWAEIEHDIQYKSTSVIPSTIRRRFIGLAGMLEIADREFQAIQDEDQRIRQQARTQIKKGDLDQVEITPDALKSFLTRKIGGDQRISWFSYDLLARTLRKLGFQNLRQVEECISGYSDDQLSKIVFGFRQGQALRFELMLLAGMGPVFIERHPWSSEEWFQTSRADALEEFKTAKISIKGFDPLAQVET